MTKALRVALLLVLSALVMSALALLAIYGMADRSGPTPTEENGDYSNMAGSLQVAQTPYRYWITETQLSAIDLSNRLREDDDFASKLCASDPRQPRGYARHIPLISTPRLNRKDIASHYQLDGNAKVKITPNNYLFVESLSAFLQQQGKVLVTHRKETERTIVWSFSTEGLFSGYCASDSAYTFVHHIVPVTQELKRYSASCLVKGSVPCLAVE